MLAQTVDDLWPISARITTTMPLPDFGYSNRETRQKQELVFPMAPGAVTVVRHTEIQSKLGGKLYSNWWDKKENRQTFVSPPQRWSSRNRLLSAAVLIQEIRRGVKLQRVSTGKKQTSLHPEGRPYSAFLLIANYQDRKTRTIFRFLLRKQTPSRSSENSWNSKPLSPQSSQVSPLSLS